MMVLSTLYNFRRLLSNAGFFFIFTFIINASCVSAKNANSFDHVILIDAGSGGSRVFVFHISEDGGSRFITASPGKSVTPGLATFGKTPKLAVEYLRPLVDYVKLEIPEATQANTPFFLMGTAGMRLLTNSQQEKIYDEVYESFFDDSNFPFHIHRSNFKTISGSEEAYYAVLSTNYLESRIDAYLLPTNHNGGMLGALDMGGASAQIIFAPEKMNNSGDKNSLTADSTARLPRITPDDFWGVSHLSYGVAEIKNRVWDYLVDQTNPEISGNRVPNPCTFAGFNEHHGYHLLVGTGDMDKCVEVIRKVIWGSEAGSCTRGEGCPIDGIKMPKINGDFYAMSIYYYTLDCVHKLGPMKIEHWPNPTIFELEQSVNQFCGMNWKNILMNHEYTGRKRMPYRCVESAYLVTLLRDGYGFLEHARSITIAKKVNGMEVEWTLGYLLAEILNGRKVENIPPITSSETDIQQSFRYLMNVSSTIFHMVKNFKSKLPDFDNVAYTVFTLVLYVLFTWYALSVLRTVRSSMKNTN